MLSKIDRAMLQATAKPKLFPNGGYGIELRKGVFDSNVLRETEEEVRVMCDKINAFRRTEVERLEKANRKNKYNGNAPAGNYQVMQVTSAPKPHDVDSYLSKIILDAMNSRQGDTTTLYNEITTLAESAGSHLQIVTFMPRGVKVLRSAHFQAFYNDTQVHICNKFF